MSWFQTPVPGEDTRPRYRRWLDQVRANPKDKTAAGAGGITWTVVSLLSAVVIAIAVWMMASEGLTAFGYAGRKLPIGIALILGVLWFFRILFQNPHTIVRRVFLTSCGLTVFALAATLGLPTLLEVLFGIAFDTSIHWGVLGALIALNLMLFIAYLSSVRSTG